jgi:glucose dehydrogenase
MIARKKLFRSGATEALAGDSNVMNRRALLIRTLLAGSAISLAGLKGCRRPISTEIAIIGSGPAGMALADSLSAAGRQVLVIEAGTANAEPEQDAFAVVPADGPLPYDLRAATLRRPGGSSRLWEGQAPRPLAHELAQWPLSLQDLSPWLDKAERWLHIAPATRLEGTPSNPYSGNSADLRRLLHDAGFIDTVPAAYSRHDRNQPSPLSLLDHGVIKQLEQRHRLTLLTGTQVSQLRFSGKRVVALRCVDEHGNQRDIEAHRVVLCGGGIQSIRLLWNSPAPGLGGVAGNQDDWLGAGFMEHPVEFSLGRLRKPVLGADTRETHVHVRDGVSEHQPQAGTLLRVGVSRGADLIEYNMIEAIFEQRPQHHNRLLPSNTRDRFGMALPQLRYRLDEQDLAAIQHGRALMSRLADSLGPVDRRTSLRPGSHHLLGGARMTRDGHQGVVDADLKVRDTDNLYLLGSAVFPSGLTVPPTLVIVALAHRLGATIAST